MAEPVPVSARDHGVAPWLGARWPEDRRFRRLLVLHLAATAVLAALVAALTLPPVPPPPLPETPPPVRLSLAPPPAPAVQARAVAPKRKRPRTVRETPPRATPKAPVAPSEAVRGRGLLAEAQALGRLAADPATRTLAEARVRAITVPKPQASRRALTRAGTARAGTVQAEAALKGRRDPVLAGRAVTRVSAPAEEEAATARPSQGRPGRTQEEIQLVFERNKGAFDRLYSRALRRNPGLGGRVTFEFTIAPSGKVLRARIIASDLGDAALERRLLIKLKSLDFGAKDVDTTVVTYWIDFLS